ncbi:MAG: hypothetical protein EBU90_00355 [Proteobacteria bacterium]|nr:hypothetical protein [Pseudomonadota bacterium]NBP12882.1 hypothetical protein [bacterium]
MSTPNLSGDFAVSLWFKANNFGSVNELITNPNGGVGGFGINLDGSGTYLTINSPNIFLENLCSYSFSTGTWYHIVVSRSNGLFRAWINGVDQNVNYQSSYDFSGPIALGWDGSNYGFGIDGTIDEVGIWEKALVQNDVNALYNGGVGKQYPFTSSSLLNGIEVYWKFDNSTWEDSTSNGRTLTNHGVVNGTGKIGSGDAVFTPNSYFDLGSTDLNLTGDFSIGFWYKPDDLSNYQTLFTSSGNFAIHHNTANGLDVNNTLAISDISTSGDFIAGTWYYITVINSSGTTSLYIDNVFKASTTQSMSIQDGIYLGAYVAFGQFYLTGELDEMGIWNRALTPSEIADLYNSGSGLSYPFGPVSVVELKDGIKTYWKLDDSTWSDSSGNGYTLTNNGGVTNGTGIINGDAIFNGYSSYLYNSSFITPVNTFSVSFWFNSNTFVDGSIMIGPWNYSNNPFNTNVSWGIGWNFGNLNVFWSQNGNSLDNRWQPIPADGLLDENWHHCVLTWNGTQQKLYIDGSFIALNTPGFNPYNSTGIGIGNGNNGYYQGNIDEVGIWDRALSQSEITTLYNNREALSHPFIPTSGLSLWLDANDSTTVSKIAPSVVPLTEYTADNKTSLLMHFDGSNGSTTFTDSSIHNRTFTASGSAIISTANSKFGGASLQVNSGYLTAPSDSSLGFDGDFTIECWLYLNNNDIGYQWFVNTSENGQDQTGWTLYTESNSLLSFLARNPNSGGWSFGLQGPQPPANEWFHYAVVRSGSTLKMFVNGVDVNASPIVSSDFSQPVAYGDTFSIGNYVFIDIPLDGFIDEVRVSKGVARFPSTFIDPATNGENVAYWADKSGKNNNAVQSNGSFRPTLSTNSINGKYTVRFDGASQYLTDTVIGVDGSHTVFIVANRRGSASGDGYEPPLSYGGISVDDGFPFCFKSNGTFATYPMWYKFAQSGQIDGVSSYSNDTTYIVSLPINTQTLTWPFVVNGISLGTADATSYTSNGNNQIVIGAQPTPNRYFNGDVAEVLIYNRVLTNTERYDVETYLNEKYNAYTIPSITQDGLVLWLDAGDSRSYPGTGSTWYDLSPSKNNGTLNGNATYNGNNGGAINLDGFNAYVNFGSYTPANESFTLEIAFTWNDYNTNNIGFLFAGNYEKLELHTGGETGTNGIRFIPSCYPGSSLDETNLIDANVNHITVVWNKESGISEIYKNGVFVTSASGRTGCGIKTLQDLNIGRRANGLLYFSGNIYITRLYDRVLDATEIAKNFAASSARFGL